MKKESRTKGTMTCSQAGKLGGAKGGDKTAATHSPEHYEQIGRQGGLATAARRRAEKGQGA